MTFDLVREVQFVSSADTPGIQLANVVASTTRAVFANPSDSDLSTLRAAVIDGLAGCIVVPGPELIDLKSAKAMRNYLILQELVRRTLVREPLLQDLAEYAIGASYAAGISQAELYAEAGVRPATPLTT